jgi:hypothetical protein
MQVGTPEPRAAHPQPSLTTTSMDSSSAVANLELRPGVKDSVRRELRDDENGSVAGVVGQVVGQGGDEGAAAGDGGLEWWEPYRREPHVAPSQGPNHASMGGVSALTRPQTRRALKPLPDCRIV